MDSKGRRIVVCDNGTGVSCFICILHFEDDFFNATVFIEKNFLSFSIQIGRLYVFSL